MGYWSLARLFMRERHSGGRIRALRENQKFPLATRAYFPALFVNRLVRQSRSALHDEFTASINGIFSQFDATSVAEMPQKFELATV